METPKPQSFFHGIRSRELHGSRVPKRSYTDCLASEFSEVGAIAAEHNGPPMAISFGKTGRNSHIVAMSDEDGYLSLFDTRRKFLASASHQENADRTKVCDWVAHQNAVFDICWIKDDSQIVTASGDQTVKVWDIQEKKCTAVLIGHTGSVKSLSPHPTNPEIIVSGSRDGSFALWDMRCNSTSKNTLGVRPTAVVKGAHLTPRTKRSRRGKAAPRSITSVLNLKDEVSIATAGAVDSVVKYWDTRSLKSVVTQTCPHMESNEKERRFHGITSLSQDSNGVFVTASCMDNSIYLYNVLQLEKGPMQSFSGGRVESFFVKSAISPDGAHILSGSSDGNAYIWQVNKPQEDPVILKSHDGEVTAVDWSHYEAGKIATSSDDFTVRIWNSENRYCPSTPSPSVIRRRVMAIPGVECRRLLMNESMHISKDGNSCPSDKGVDESKSLNPIKMPRICTPDSQKKHSLLDSDMSETFEKTPEATFKSPSSVLNPPSLKRKTICDYFAVPTLNF
ncbi:uncharacterized protein LOC126800295 [Argentina anserina]|uniref:uncharacterized protein LOC126800295 n=1 Tax=Argentina anserina TaxID=57926 RepID=UPI0021766456|nr:uncharacterized protein LOC126800295 [Potentilla anserina]